MSEPVYFETQHRASFQEIDPYGHLNTAHYVSYYLNHRFIALRERFGLDLQGITDLPFAFFISGLEVSFVKPVLGDQIFKVTSHVSAATRVTCHVTCEMVDEQGQMLSRAVMKTVCVDKVSGKPIGWPDGFMARFYA